MVTKCAESLRLLGIYLTDLLCGVFLIHVRMCTRSINLKLGKGIWVGVRPVLCGVWGLWWLSRTYTVQ
jgi:hypothetical protein